MKVIADSFRTRKSGSSIDKELWLIDAECDSRNVVTCCKEFVAMCGRDDDEKAIPSKNHAYSS